MRVWSFFLVFFSVLFLIVKQSRELDFSHRRIQVGSKSIVVEVAESELQQRRGLSHRKELKKDGGMLFIFPKEGRYSFWMKDTWIPLSIGFFDKDGVLLEIQDMAVVVSGSLSAYTSKRAFLYALEVNREFFKRHRIKLGAKLKLFQGLD